MERVFSLSTLSLLFISYCTAVEGLQFYRRLSLTIFRLNIQNIVQLVEAAGTRCHVVVNS